ncbi:MAG: hypothetical protein ABSB22_01335 [Thermodesulfobacteriota bacterium]
MKSIPFNWEGIGYNAISDKNFFGSIFKDLITWRTWIVALKAIFGLMMSNEELSLYQRRYTGRENLIQGRRGALQVDKGEIAIE